ncbi:uncharacterized protein LOC143919923 [Arctopsyche grandis]|uniref:uncharacterized protein LOC143919923 n=1 Tax=Arctopsyche grandis TaxID=121162 RepID=UPI00406D93A5
MSLLEVFWLDVLLPQVLARLTLKDCFNLRCVSRDFRTLIDLHLHALKVLKILNRRCFPKESFQVLSLCEKIAVLNFSKCNFLSDDLLIPFLSQNKNITSVNLSNCQNITARSIQPLILHCNLRVLKLSRCTWLTPGAIEALSLHQSSLEEIDLSYCSFSSDGCLIILFKKFRNIKILSLEGVPQIGDRCVYAIAKFLSSIKHLNIACCHKVTDIGIGYIADSCWNLESLAVRTCVRVSEKSLAPIRKRKILVDRRPNSQTLPMFLQLSQIQAFIR